jgi:ATP-binding cassette subfamily B protein
MARSHLQQLAFYLRPHQRMAWLGIGSLLLVNAMGVFLPWYIRMAIDDLAGAAPLTNPGSQVVVYALVVLAVATVMMGIRIVSRVWMFGIGRQVEFDLKQSIFEHLLRLPPSYFSTQKAGDIISRVTSDVENVRRLLGFALLSLANTVFAYALTLPAMLVIDVRLSLLALSVYPFMLILVKLTSSRLQKQQLEVQQHLSHMSDLIQEDMNGITLIKVYAQEGHEQGAFDRRNQKLLDANLTLAFTRNWLFPSLIALVGLSLLALLSVGGPLIGSGDLSLGDFSALTLYVERLVFPTALLGFTITAYQRGQVSLDRIEAILGVEPTIQDSPDSTLLRDPKGHIRAQDLTFTFPGTDKPALDRVSFEIHPGQMVAIVGPIGSGKTTLANAIPHLLEISPQQLWIDGQDVTRLQLGSLRRSIAYVPQESFLFNATVRDNIRYGQPDASDHEVELAAKAARIHDEIQTFPIGYDTLVGERGITLSGGQRQRVALARALLVDLPILILDDSLSSVDNQTALEILANLSQHFGSQNFGAQHYGALQQRKTVISISHRLTTIIDSDQILVMKEGQIVESGSHAQLLSQSGLYRYLWDQQKLEEVLQ